MSNFSTATTGWVAIATGVSAILAIIFLILMATVNMLFGPINDVFNGMIGVLSVVLAWMLYAEHHAKSPLLSQVAFALALVGAILTVVGSVLVIFKFTGFVLAGLYTSVGNALIGLWLVAFCYSMRRGNELPGNLLTFGLVDGVFLAMGLVCILGIFAGVDSMESLPWYLYLGYFGFLGIYIMYPIWTIWLGRVLLFKWNNHRILKRNDASQSQCDYP